MHEQNPVQKREYVSYIQPIFLILTLTVAVVLGACDMPTGFEDIEAAASESNAVRSNDADAGIIVDADGTARPLSAEEVEAFSPAAPGEQRVALIIAGAATFDDNTWSSLRMNVRQTNGGAIAGQGRVTLRDQTTDFTPVCVKERDLWGRSYYGITMELDEPHIRYGNAYEYVTVTITGDGQLSPGAIYRHSAVCGYSAALYPKEAATGQINVMLTGN